MRYMCTTQDIQSHDVKLRSYADPSTPVFDLCARKMARFSFFNRGWTQDGDRMIRARHT
jgi:hypothetical protein